MPDIGFVGLGMMGGALATRMSAQTTLRVFDLDAARVLELEAVGATGATSPGQIGRLCDVVVMCLPTSAQVRSLLIDGAGSGDGDGSGRGSDGLAANLRAGSLVIDCTSGDPAVSREIAASLLDRNISYVDAPVSGGPQAAAAGTIAVMLGGPIDAVLRAKPVIELISPNIRHVGDVGAGHCVKLLNNVLAAGHRLLAFEMCAIAAANGVDPATFIDVVNISSGRSYATEVTLPRHVFGGDLVQGFSLGLMAKDVNLGARLVPDGLTDLSLTTEISSRLVQALRMLGSDADINEVLALYEIAIGQQIATSTTRGEAASMGGALGAHR
jgi:3-hydroxyisobutyrate dehydrogenase